LDVDYKHNFEEVLILDEDWHKVEGLNWWTNIKNFTRQ
jgi:hypothetical protein